MYRRHGAAGFLARNLQGEESFSLMSRLKSFWNLDSMGQTLTASASGVE